MYDREEILKERQLNTNFTLKEERQVRLGVERCGQWAHQHMAGPVHSLSLAFVELWISVFCISFLGNLILLICFIYYLKGVTISGLGWCLCVACGTSLMRSFKVISRRLPAARLRTLYLYSIRGLCCISPVAFENKGNCMQGWGQSASLGLLRPRGLYICPVSVAGRRGPHSH